MHGMNTICTRDGTSIFYKEWGMGHPVVFSHGWPLNADNWEAQMLFLASNGYRCIAHDDLHFAEGKHEELLGRIQKRTGEIRETVENTIPESWTSCCKQVANFVDQKPPP